MKDTWFSLASQQVLGGAQKGAVVQVGHGGVNDHTSTSQAHRELLLGHLQGLGRVVEPPRPSGHLGREHKEG